MCFHDEIQRTCYGRVFDDNSWIILLFFFINPCPAEEIKMPHPFLIFNQSDYLIQIFLYKLTYLMANSAAPDQLASSEAN